MGNTAKIRHRRRRRRHRATAAQIQRGAEVLEQFTSAGFKVLSDDGVIRVFGRGALVDDA